MTPVGKGRSKAGLGCNFLTSFTLSLSGMPKDWALNLSRFLLEAIVSESGRRAKSIDPQIEGGEAGAGCNGDGLFAPMQTGKAFLTGLERRDWSR